MTLRVCRCLHRGPATAQSSAVHIPHIQIPAEHAKMEEQHSPLICRNRNRNCERHIPCLQKPLSYQGQSLIFDSGSMCKNGHSLLLHSPVPKETHFSVNGAGLRSKWLSKHYLDHVAPTELLPTFVSSGTSVSLPALTSWRAPRTHPWSAKFYQTGWFMFFKNNGGTKFERAVMVIKPKHLVHHKCGETTNCTLTSIQGNLQDCKFLAPSCLIMSRSPELESKCTKVLHAHALCCSSAPQNQSHAKTSCSAYSSHTPKKLT